MWYTIRTILRAQAGFAGILAVAVYVHNLAPDGLDEARISGYFFTAAVLFWSLVGYLCTRLYFARFTALFLSVEVAAIVSTQFGRVKSNDDLVVFALLGIAIALSAYLALGWLDRNAAPFSERSSW